MKTQKINTLFFFRPRRCGTKADVYPPGVRSAPPVPTHPSEFPPLAPHPRRWTEARGWGEASPRQQGGKKKDNKTTEPGFRRGCVDGTRLLSPSRGHNRVKENVEKTSADVEDNPKQMLALAKRPSIQFSLAFCRKLHILAVRLHKRSAFPSPRVVVVVVGGTAFRSANQAWTRLLLPPTWRLLGNCAQFP